MSSRITPGRALENLRKEAKRWLKALRANDPAARARLERALPDASTAPTLRDVQHALAREHGFAGWSALRAALATRPTATGSSAPDEIVQRFLDNACPDHHVRGGPDHVRARATAMRLLERYPAIAHANVYTEIVCGDLEAVRRRLAEDPGLARRRDSEPSRVRSGAGGGEDLTRVSLGPKGWEPLHYLCFTRLDLPATRDNAVEIARLLLDHGADPDAYFMAGDSRYTPLVGVAGEGEENRPPHPRRDELARLLLERGAEPYDIQVVYDIHFRGDVLWFLELAYEFSVKRGREADWKHPDWPMLDMGGYGNGARWHLWIAVKHGDVALARWCLEHGANPNAAPARDPRLPQGTLYEEAVRRGQSEIAELLVRHGAERVPVVLDEFAEFLAACRRLDRDAIRARAVAHPEYLQRAEPLLDAARRDQVELAAFLLDLGMSPDVENAGKERPLHLAAYNGAERTARLLIDRGADVDARESSWQNTPLDAATWAGHRPLIDLLGRHSRDVWALTHAGKLDRLRQVLAEDPARARAHSGGHTPLMWLPPDDERNALAIARLLLEHGADPAIRNEDGMTAADRAERNGMYEVAELLGGAASARTTPMLERYERMAANLLEAYRTGTPEAMRRHWNDTWHRRSWDAMRRYVQLDLGKRTPGDTADPDAPADIEITIDDARQWVARDHGFERWDALVEFAASARPDDRPIAATPVRVHRAGDDEYSGERTRDWNAALELLAAGTYDALDANGQMTDDLLGRVARLEHLTTLRLGGSVALTDAGVERLARLTKLRHLDLGGCPVTDRALAAIAELPVLESLGLSWTRVTDAGVAPLARCRRLERLDLSGTRTGDGAVRAMAGLPRLRHFRSGAQVTDAGLAFLSDFPVFARWQGGEARMELLSPDVEPNSLALRGTFTDRGMPHLARLEGLFALNIDDRALPVTAAGLAPLVSLPHLGFLAFDAHDDAMPYIAAMPALRFLIAQDTDAGDEGFVALARSSTLEYFWGRRCHGLRDRGFTALSTMPSLRALSASCRNVGDVALAALPDFPALRELMPIDVPDEGYRHIGRCERLERLVLMYCRDTGDRATELIAPLEQLRHYFASYTRITDHSLTILAAMPSLERIELVGCAGVTDAGIAALAGSTALRELSLSGMQNVGRDAVATFPARVRVRYSP